MVSPGGVGQGTYGGHMTLLHSCAVHVYTHVESAIMAAGSSSSCIWTASVFLAPASSRPRDHSDGNEDNDEVCILTLGDPFRYTISSFDVIAIELRQLRMKGYNTDGEELTFNAFIRNDPSLNRSYPAWMTITDGTAIDIRFGS